MSWNSADVTLGGWWRPDQEAQPGLSVRILLGPATATASPGRSQDRSQTQPSGARVHRHTGQAGPRWEVKPRLLSGPGGSTWGCRGPVSLACLGGVGSRKRPRRESGTQGGLCRWAAVQEVPARNQPQHHASTQVSSSNGMQTAGPCAQRGPGATGAGTSGSPGEGPALGILPSTPDGQAAELVGQEAWGLGSKVQRGGYGGPIPRLFSGSLRERVSQEQALLPPGFSL